MSQLNPPLTKEDFTQTCWQGVVKSSESKDCYTYSQAFQTKERQAQELGNLREKHVFYILKFTTN